MGTVTYPEEAVAQAVNERFVGCRVNTQSDEAKATIERYHQAWTPDIKVLDPADGTELYHWNGYLPPFECLPQLLAAEAHARLRLQHLDQAAAGYDEVLRRFPTALVAPEAQYFAAVARYKASHEGADLQKGWADLRSRYPDSTWRLKQSFMEQ